MEVAAIHDEARLSRSAPGAGAALRCGAPRCGHPGGRCGPRRATGRLELRHHVVDGVTLEEKDADRVLQHLADLWGYEVQAGGER